MGDFRKVGLITCTALAMANMIGTGVFTSLGFQVMAIPSPFLILLLWVLGGLVALCGAMSYAELAAALPRSGGSTTFFRRSIIRPSDSWVGLSPWRSDFRRPSPCLRWPLGNTRRRPCRGTSATSVSASVSVSVVLLLALVHSFTVRASGNFQVVITSLKVALIVGFILLGFWRRGALDVTPLAGDFGRALSGPFAVSLMFVLYAYSGWNAAAYIIGEVREPQRTVPASLLLATVVVTILYVFLNAVFLASGPMSGFAGKIEVGEIAARNLLGEQGGRIMSALIAGGLISSVSAMTWAGSRVRRPSERIFLLLESWRGPPPAAFLAWLSEFKQLWCSSWWPLQHLRPCLCTPNFRSLLAAF